MAAAPATDLTGKIALVTGGSRGVGRDIALRLAAAGADVAITYRTQAEFADEVVRRIRDGGRRAESLRAYLTGTDHIEELVDTFDGVLAGWEAGGFDVLVNNAGIGSHQPVGQITEEEVDRVYETNFKSVVFLTQALLPRLRDNGWILALGSGLGRFALPGFSVYGSLKAALEQYIRYLAKELGARGITANAISPGALDTDFNAAAFEHDPQMREIISSATALGRVGLAEDVGGVAAFLCSDAGGWVTGQRLEISGGMFL